MKRKILYNLLLFTSTFFLYVTPATAHEDHRHEPPEPTIFGINQDVVLIGGTIIFLAIVCFIVLKYIYPKTKEGQ